MADMSVYEPVNASEPQRSEVRADGWVDPVPRAHKEARDSAAGAIARWRVMRRMTARHLLGRYYETDRPRVWEWSRRLLARRHHAGPVVAGALPPEGARVIAAVDRILANAPRVTPCEDGVAKGHRWWRPTLAGSRSKRGGGGGNAVARASLMHEHLINKVSSDDWQDEETAHTGRRREPLQQDDYIHDDRARSTSVPLTLVDDLAEVAGDVTMADMMMAEPHRPTRRAGTQWVEGGGVYARDPQDCGDLLNPSWATCMVAALRDAKRHVLAYRRRSAEGQAVTDPTAAHVTDQVVTAPGSPQLLRVHSDDGRYRSILAPAHPAVILAQVKREPPSWWQRLSQRRQRQLVAWLLSRTSFRAGGGDGQVAARTVHRWLTRPSRIPKLLQADAAASDDQHRKDALRSLAKAIAVVTAKKLKAS